LNLVVSGVPVLSADVLVVVPDVLVVVAFDVPVLVVPDVRVLEVRVLAALDVPVLFADVRAGSGLAFGGLGDQTQNP
jgi:hypothetical protein